MDEALARISRLAEHFSNLEQSAKQYAIHLPTPQPHLFDEPNLERAEGLASELNCECPRHLSDLIRRLNAFEEYSKTCESDNWKQAAIHSCIHTYTHQARYLMERALQAVLDE